MRENPGSFAARVSGESRHPVDRDGWHEHSLPDQCLPQRVEQLFIPQLLRGTGQEDMQPVVLLDHLPPAHRQRIDYELKQERIDALFTSSGRREIEHLWRPSLDGLNQGKWASAGAALEGGSTHQVSHLVADERLRAAKKHGDEHFVPLLAGRDWTVILVHDLDNREILEKVQTLMERALRCQETALGCPIRLEEFYLPCLLNAPPRVACQRFCRASDQVGSDVQPSLALLIGQNRSN